MAVVTSYRYRVECDGNDGNGCMLNRVTGTIEDGDYLVESIQRNGWTCMPGEIWLCPECAKHPYRG
jgi:hypothetical protein